MPAAIAVPLISAGVTGTTSLIGAHMQSSAAEDAAAKQLQANEEALQFQREQAKQDLASAQAASRGNYDQWAARQQRLSQLGQTVGMQPFQIPAYVPIPDVNKPTAPPRVTTMRAVVGQ